MSLTLNVDKNTHKVIISKAELSKNNIECIASASLNVEMLNLGDEDEDESVLEVTSDELKINVKDAVELSSGIDDDSIYIKKVSINTKDLKAGTYPITIRAYRDTDKLEATKTVDLTVLECKVAEKPIEKPIVVSVCGNNVVETGEECDDGNKMGGDGCSISCRIEQPVTPVTPVTIEENFWDQYGTTVLIIGGEVIFLFIVLVIVAVALRKK